MNVDHCDYEVTKDALPWFMAVSLFYPDAPAGLRFGFAEAMSDWWLWAEGENESSEFDPKVFKHDDLEPWRRHFWEAREGALDMLRRIDRDLGISLDDLVAMVRVKGDRVLLPQDIHTPETEH